MGKKWTRFQQSVLQNDGIADTQDILREFAARLKGQNGYPPILPTAGVDLDNILDELEEVYQNVGRSDDTDTTETS